MNVENAIVALEDDGFEYVLAEDHLVATADEDSTQIAEQFQNVVYAGGPTVLLGGNEYYIQTGDGDTFVVDGNDTMEDLYVNENDRPQDDDTVRYVDEEDAASPPIFYDVGGKRLKMENGKVFTYDDTERLRNELGVLNQVAGSDSSIQYAVLKDGQLHLQISENDTVEILSNQEFIDAEEHLEVQLYTENDAADAGCGDGGFSPLDIKGRNVLTGKTISLNDYFEKPSSKNGRGVETEGGGKGDSFVNQKFTIGRKPNGKYLVGKILNIQTAEKESVESEPNESCGKIQEIVFDASGNILEVADGVERVLNEDVTEEQLGFVSKTLNGLTEMSSIQKKLIGKLLDVKLVEKRVDEDGECVRKVNNFSGFLTAQINEENAKWYVFNLADFEREITSNKETTYLVISTTTDVKGQKTTRVTFTGKSQQVPSFHVEKSFACTVCGSRFNDTPSLTVHRKELGHYFGCDMCGKNFTSSASLSRHSTAHESVPKRADAAPDCTACGQRFVDESGLLKHRLTSHVEPLRCRQCDRSFGNAVDLKVHRRSDHPPKCYFCQTCGRRFSRHSNLLRHEEIHGGQGNLHTCTVCGCSYKFISSLTRHIVQNHVKKF